MNTKNLQRCVIASLFAVSALSVHAAGITIVDWSGDYVSSSSNFNFTGTPVTDTVTTRTWGDANLTPTTGYAAPPGRTGQLFGALEHTNNLGPVNFGANRIANSGTNDFINFQAHSATGLTSSTLKGIIYFTKTNFLNSMNSNPIGLTEMSGSLNITEQSGIGVYRFAVLNGSDWYLSSTTATSTGAFNIADFGTTNWGAWSLPVASAFSATPVTYGVEGSTLTDVQAVGFYFDVSRDGQARVSFDSFEIIAIPEPGTLALLGIALGTVLLFRRKR